MKKSYFPISTAILAMIAMASASANAVAQPARQVIRPLTVLAEEAVRAQSVPAAVQVNFEMLGALRSGDGIALPLTQGIERSAVVQRIERRGAGRYSVFGRFEGDDDGFFILTVERDAIAGLFETSTDGAYRLEHLDAGLAEVSWIDRAGFAKCGLPSGGNPGAAAAAPQGQGATALVLNEQSDSDDEEVFATRGGCPAPRRTFDVIIAYTQAARDEAGGTSAIEVLAQLAVDTTNQIYVDSQISPRMQLVWTKQVPYVESNDVFDDRNALKDPADGQMDQLHNDRDEFGADFVILFVDSSDPDYCGVAYCTPSGSEQGFCVVQQGCSVNNLSFPHEIGHLQGCAHNAQDSGFGCNDSCYSYGNQFIGLSGDPFRTVMAYDSDPAAYTRIGKFSNPAVNHDGVPTGFDCPFLLKGANNAQTIDDTASDREGWRLSKLDVWVEEGVTAPWLGTFNTPWPDVALGVATLYGGTRTPTAQPTLHIKAGTYDETMTITKPMTIDPCGGSVTIGRS